MKFIPREKSAGEKLAEMLDPEISKRVDKSVEYFKNQKNKYPDTFISKQEQEISEQDFHKLLDQEELK